jgi:hypothetical protein
MMPGYNEVQVHSKELLEEYKRQAQKRALIAEIKAQAIKKRRFRKLVGQLTIRVGQKIAAEPSQEGSLI